MRVLGHADSPSVSLSKFSPRLCGNFVPCTRCPCYRKGLWNDLQCWQSASINRILINPLQLHRFSTACCHFPDKCWWKGPTYNIDQTIFIWSLPNDTVNNAQRQHMSTHPGTSYNNATIDCEQTGAAANVRDPHTPLKQLRAEDPKMPTVVNGGQIIIHGIKQLTMLYNKIAVPFRRQLCNLGSDTIMRNGLRLTIDGYRGYLGNDQTKLKLHYTGNHFYIKVQCLTDRTTILTTRRTSRVGTTTGITISSRRIWSMDYV
eukprot:1907022-Amphidinium_carterae.1